MIELLIAILIATLLCGVVMYLFSQTQRATRVSLAAASLAVSASGVDARLRLDAANLLGPNRLPGGEGGCLVIVPALRLGYVPLANGQMSKNKVRLRSDQLVFMSCRDITSGHPWISLYPTDRNTVAEPTAQPTARSSWEARIWYGGLRDGTMSPVPDSPDNPYWAAHLWPVGRQAKLFVGGNAALTSDCTIAGAGDTVGGTLPAFKDAAIAANWSDQDYMDKLIGAGIPDSRTDYTNQPAASPRLDLKALGGGRQEQGIQLDADVVQSTLKLFDNCSEVIVQWAGDLDKDGQIDTYPFVSPGPGRPVPSPSHPLAGSIIWYPEEFHDKGAWYNGTAAPRLEGWPATGIGAKYQAIRDCPWKWTFDPSNTTVGGAFAPSTSRFGGHDLAAKGFELDYGDIDHATAPEPAGAPAVPAPYVFRFEDDQYRLVRYGFRQDGSVYANQWNGQPLPDSAGTLHATPYPPMWYSPTVLSTNFSPTTYNSTAGGGYAGNTTYAGTTVIAPYTSQLYLGRKAPDGPYPRAAVAAAADGFNFGDLMGSQPVPTDGMTAVNLKATGPNGERYRTGGNGIPNDPDEYGQWVKVTMSATPPWLVYGNTSGTLPTVTLELTKPDTTGAVAPALYSADQITALQGAPLWPYYTGNHLVVLNQAGKVIAKTPAPASDPTPGTPAADYPLIKRDSTRRMEQKNGPANNYTRNYTDLWAEYFKTINPPAAGQPDKRGTVEDWRMPQSDWPRLIRIRFRLHDSQGLVTSYSDEFLVNGRDNDGDGVVNNKEEGRMSGMWFEYIVAIPATTNTTRPAYPMDIPGAWQVAPPGYTGALPYLNPGPRNH